MKAKIKKSGKLFLYLETKKEVTKSRNYLESLNAKITMPKNIGKYAHWEVESIKIVPVITLKK
jgi:hypothetical protein